MKELNDDDEWTVRTALVLASICVFYIGFFSVKVTFSVLLLYVLPGKPVQKMTYYYVKPYSLAHS